MEHDLESIIARLEILEIGVCNILQNPGNIGNLLFPIFPYPGNTGNMLFSTFWVFFTKKTRAEISRRMVRFSRPIQGQKLKLFQPPILPLFFPSSKPLATTMQKQSQTIIDSYLA